MALSSFHHTENMRSYPVSPERTTVALTLIGLLLIGVLLLLAR